LGTTQSLDTIKPLMAALCFHQFFEGMGLGGCISQVLPSVKYKLFFTSHRKYAWKNAAKIGMFN